MKSLGVLALILFTSAPASAALAQETMNLSYQGRDPRSASTIFAHQLAYEPRSAQAANVNMRVIGAYLGMIYDPNVPPADYERRLREVRTQAVKEVRGQSYRGGMIEALTKDTLNIGVAWVSKGKVSVPNTVDFIAGKAIDQFATPAAKLNQNFEINVGVNGFALERMGKDDSLGKVLRENNADFYPELNPDLSLDLSPLVMKSRMEEQASRELAKLTALNEKLLNKEQPKQEEPITKEDLRQEVKEITKEVKALLATPSDNEEKRRAFEDRAKNVMKACGGLSALAAAHGFPKEAQLLSKIGGVLSSGLAAYASTFTFSLNKGATVAAFLDFAGQAAGMFGDESGNAQAEMHQAVMQELFEIKQMIVELGKQMDLRFDILDQNLHGFMTETMKRMDKQDFLLQRSDVSNAYFAGALANIRAASFGTYVMVAALEWNKIESECFSKDPKVRARVSATTFRDCRNRIAILGLVGPGGDNSRVGAAADVVDSIAGRISTLVPRPAELPAEVRPNPAAWLAATRALADMQRLYPQFAKIVMEEGNDRAGLAGYSSLRETGIYFSAFTQNMALEEGKTGKFKLRRAFIDSLLESYEAAVRKAYMYGNGAAGQTLGAAPNPNVSFYSQEMKRDRDLYPFLSSGIPLCEGSKVNYVFNDTSFRGIGEDRPGTMDLSRAYSNNAGNLKFPDQMMDSLPRPIFLALASDLRKPERWGLSVNSCLESATIENHYSLVRPDDYYTEYKSGLMDKYYASSKWAFQILIKASYFKNGKAKNLNLVRLRSHNSFHERIPYDLVKANPFMAIWYGVPTSTVHTAAGSISQLPGQFFDDKLQMDEFEADLADTLQAIKAEVNRSIKDDMAAYERMTTLARDELSFVLERGIQNNSPATEALLRAVADGGTFPSASVWAKAQYQAGYNQTQMEEILKNQLKGFRSLLDAVENDGNLQPGRNLFEERLNELQALASRPPPAAKKSGAGSRRPR